MRSTGRPRSVARAEAGRVEVVRPGGARGLDAPGAWGGPAWGLGAPPAALTGRGDSAIIGACRGRARSSLESSARGRSKVGNPPPRSSVSKHHVLSSWLLTLTLAPLGAACDAAVAANQQAAAEAEAKADVKVEVKAEAEAGGPSSIAGDMIAAADGKVEATPTAVVNTEVKAHIKSADLDLESVTYLVKKGKVKNASELEKKINNPKEKMNHIDVDGDGKVDFIKIVEVKKADGVIVFELHAIPSGTKDEGAAVVIAYVDFTPDKATGVLVVKATYAPVVIGYDTIVYDYTVPIVVQNDTVVVTGGVGFYGWLFSVRPAYVGVVVWGPPVVVIEGGCWPPGHCKHHKFKGKGKHKWH